MFMTSLQNSKTSCENLSQKNYCSLLKFKMEYVPSGIFNTTFSNTFLVDAPFLYCLKKSKNFYQNANMEVKKVQTRGELKKLRFIYQIFFIWRNTGMVFVLKYGFQCWGRNFHHKLVSFMTLLCCMVIQKKKNTHLLIIVLFTIFRSYQFITHQNLLSFDFSLSNDFGLTIHKNFLLSGVTFLFKVS